MRLSTMVLVHLNANDTAHVTIAKVSMHIAMKYPLWAVKYWNSMSGVELVLFVELFPMLLLFTGPELEGLEEVYDT
jgi:hypothetical protein